MIISEKDIEKLEIFILHKRKQYLVNLQMEQMLPNSIQTKKEKKAMRQLFKSIFGEVNFANYLDLPKNLPVCKIFDQQGPEGLAKLILSLRYPGEVFWILSEDGETKERY